ncbi:uncharacterized protein LOC114580110 [Dendrobium catenatum]|uniref:uncharacterized protein LOC114580110 n=1 Tax=Dendrobium catenatum TaxID=906689 RepID=UPI00109F11E9|nr:uncharacterized protein LOC114580110 [Dendrobium catenatum]
MGTRRIESIEEKVGEWEVEFTALKEKFASVDEKLDGVEELKTQMLGLQEMIKQMVAGQHNIGGSVNPNPNPNPIAPPVDGEGGSRVREGPNAKGKEAIDIVDHGGDAWSAGPRGGRYGPNRGGEDYSTAGFMGDARASYTQNHPDQFVQGREGGSMPYNQWGGGPYRGRGEADPREPHWGSAGYARGDPVAPQAWERRESRGVDPRPWERQPEGRYGQGGMGNGRVNGRGEWGMRKLKLPIFEGEDAYGWIFKAERYFTAMGMTDEEKLLAVPLCLEARALAWYQWTEERQRFRCWAEFREMCLDRFRPPKEGTHHEQFFALTQTGTVSAYRDRFELLSSRLRGMTDEVLEGNFMKGLKPHIRSAVRAAKPRSLRETLEMAELIEDRLSSDQYRRPTFFGGGQKVANPTGGAKGAYLGAGGEGQKERDRSAPAKGEFRRLTEAELKDKRAKGLCYRCDEKFGPGHRCKDKLLQVLLVEDPEGEEVEEELGGEEEGVDHLHLDMIEVSLNSVAGLTAHSTMKMEGRIGSFTVTVLIDSGATHNFIACRLVEELGIPMIQGRGVGVSLGTGQKEQCAGRCSGVTLSIQGEDITQDFLVLELGNTDVILGIQWLQTLGEMKVNWKTLMLEYGEGEHRVTLHGDPKLCRSKVALKTILKSLRSEGEGFLIELWRLEGSEPVEEQNIPEEVGELLEEFTPVFQMPAGLPPQRSKEHAIVLKGGADPVSVRPYRYPHAQKEEIEKLVREMMEAGVIQPSVSPFSSPVLLVKKKDGSWRFCVDYRALNKETVLDKFPIPVIDELLDELGGATMFSKLDLKSGYHQIRMRREDIPKTAFRTHEGHYEFLVMPFGLTNAPSTFQALMNQVFQPMLRRFVLVFFDDILIYSRSLQEHLEHLRKVLNTLQHHQLYVNQKKCSFAQRSVEYLGHIISAEGVAADPSKVEAMTSWPTPKNLRALRGFLGLTGYYRKFIKGYGSIAAPLTEQLKKDSFNWGPEADSAMEALKRAMVSAPVLALPDFKQQLVVETDASGLGLGAVLMQQGRPIAFYSQVLSGRARLKSVYERELMAIVKAIQKWRPYLLGRRFLVRTDQRSLKYLLEQRMVTEEHQRWLSKLLGYDFEIQYKPGLENKAADALSRKVECSQLIATSVPQLVDWGKLRTENMTSEELGSFREAIRKGEEIPAGYTVEDQLLLHKGRLVLPRTSSHIPLILQEFHASAIGGHSGGQKTYQRLAREIYWKGMRKDVEEMVAQCDTCQRNKYQACAPGGLLQPLELPDQVWSEVTMDFIEGLPKSDGYTVILVVVDRLSKYAHFIPLRHPFNATTVAAVFIREIVRLHGFPESIVSDRDKVFLSHFWKEMFKLQGTHLKRSSTYQTENR